LGYENEREIVLLTNLLEFGFTTIGYLQKILHVVGGGMRWHAGWLLHAYPSPSRKSERGSG
jgi:hypothetical protein